MNESGVVRALTIAGSDSGGGAGIQADLKTFAAHGIHGSSAITAVTAQNTVGVDAVAVLAPAMVRAQLEAVLSDIGADAIKIGMLADAATIETVAAVLAEYPDIPVVLDPVAVSSNGDTLLAPEAVAALIALAPRATVLTPNLAEVELLVGERVESEEGMLGAAEALLALGPRWVLVKGGHGTGPQATDLLTDGETSVWLHADRVPTTDTHGTGCTLSSAIAANLASAAPDVSDEAVIAAVRAAKTYLTGAVRSGVRIGAGHGPVDHAWQTRGT